MRFTQDFVGKRLIVTMPGNADRGSLLARLTCIYIDVLKRCLMNHGKAWVKLRCLKP